MPIELPNGKEFPTFDELPMEGEMWQCETCTYIAQPIELNNDDHPRCPHCAQRMTLTTKEGVHVFRCKNFRVPLPPKLHKKYPKLAPKTPKKK